MLGSPPLRRATSRLSRLRRLAARLLVGAALVAAQAEPAAAGGPEEATRVGQEAEQAFAAGRVDEALQLARKARDLAARGAGKSTPAYAMALQRLAMLAWQAWKLDEAEPAAREAVERFEKLAVGSQPASDVAVALTTARGMLAVIQADRDDLAGSMATWQLVVTTPGLAPSDEADAWKELARVERRLGQGSAAAEHMEKALLIREGLGVKDAALFDIRTRAGAALAWAHRATEAEQALDGALALGTELYGAEAAELGAPLLNLGSLHSEVGDYGRAATELERAAAIFDRTGATAADRANAHAFVARNRLFWGDAERARASAERAVAAGQGDPDATFAVHAALSILGTLALEEGDLDAAEAAFGRILAETEAALGSDHAATGQALVAMATVACQRLELDRCRDTYQRAVELVEKDGSFATQARAGLAYAEFALGHTERAVVGLEQVRATLDQALGPEHPTTLGFTAALASYLAATGERAKAREVLGGVLEAREAQVAHVLLAGEDRVKQDFLGTLAIESDAIHGLCASDPSDEAACRLGLETALRRKGRALDAMRDAMDMLGRGLDPRGREVLAELVRVRAALTRATLGGVAADPALAERSASLEAELGAASAQFRRELVPVTVEGVQSALPTDAALVEIVAYGRPSARDARGWVTGLADQRYAVYVLRSEGPARAVDLGAAAEIDALASDLRRALSDPSSEPRAPARALDARIMAPLRPLLGDATRLLVSPEGSLGLVPFAALVDDDGHYLVERYDVSYLTSGRDLLRPQKPAGTEVVLVGAPDFGERPARPKSASAPASSDAGDADPDGGPGAAPAGQRGLDPRKIAFPPLPGSSSEIALLARALSASRVLTGVDASEQALKALHGPRILHVSTHGFFLPSLRAASSPAMNGAGLGPLGSAARAGLGADPLLRSGLALAGANTRSLAAAGPDTAATEDGILTALEASTIDLAGTELVVLSACETGVGEVRTGEGVLGLRRALLVAGAETLVMSLWRVDDASTRDLMVGYYRELAAGRGRSEALRRVELAMLAEPATAHPYHWASFVTVGRSEPLAGAFAPTLPTVAPGPRGCACQLGARSPGGSLAFAALALAALARRRGERRARRRRLAGLLLAAAVLVATHAEPAWAGGPNDEAARIGHDAEQAFAEGRKEDAYRLARTARDLLARAGSKETPEYAVALHRVAFLAWQNAKLDVAEPAAREAVERFTKLGTGAEALVGLRAARWALAIILADRGELAGAREAWQRVLATPGFAPSEQADAWKELARVERGLGDGAAAAGHMQKALELREGLGEKNAALFELRTRAGGLFRDNGQLEEAEHALAAAIELGRELFAPDAIQLAAPTLLLGGVHQERGDYGQAAAELERAAAIFDARDAPAADRSNAHSWVAKNRLMWGDRGRARAEAERTIAAAEGHPEARPALHVALGVLGTLALQDEDFDGADAAFARILAETEAAAGRESSAAGSALVPVGTIACMRGELERCRELYARAVQLVETEGILATQARMGVAYADFALGRVARAAEEVELVHATLEQVLGPEHPGTLEAASVLASYLIVASERTRATELLQKVLDARERQVARVLLVGEDRVKQAFLGTLTMEQYAAHSLCLGDPSDTTACHLGMETALRRKGRALDAMRDATAALGRGLDAHGRALLDELVQARGALTRAALGGAAGDAALGERAAHLEAELGAASATFRHELTPATVERVQSALPTDSALVEFVSYKRPGVADATGPESDERYGAYVLANEGPPRAVDLGPGGPIDALAAELRSLLADPASDPRQAARALDERVMQPLRPLLGSASRLVVSPEGALGLVPFSALVDESDRYLVERYDVSYVTSGRDLLRPQLPTGRAIVLLGAPDFGERPPKPGGSHGAGGDEAEAWAGTVETSRGLDPRKLAFPPLPGSSAEMALLQRALAPDEVLTGEAASETALKALHAPRILHVSTHGFFLPALQSGRTAKAALAGVGAPGGTAGADLSSDPLLRSGLALAGANARGAAPSEGDDGILTALEASTLDLAGTELVVLSACETGVGEVRTGEGVLGLRRALLVAGAETLVMSLWRVDDASTRDLMVGYYRELAAGRGRSEALRRVELAMLAEPATAHPYHWASFVAVGRSEPLASGFAPTVPTVAPGARGCACGVGGESHGSSIALALLALAIASRRGRRARAA